MVRPVLERVITAGFQGLKGGVAPLKKGLDREQSSVLVQHDAVGFIGAASVA